METKRTSEDWLVQLRQILSRLNSRKLPATPLRIALLGVGNDLRGDDAAGSLIARALQPIFGGQPNMLVIDGGYAPENQTGILRRFMPDLVLLIDAAAMGTVVSGAVRWLNLNELDGLSASTHTLPLNVLARYLNLELHCEVALIGIQPEQIEFGTGVSLSVGQAVTDVTHCLTAILRNLQQL